MYTYYGTHDVPHRSTYSIAVLESHPTLAKASPGYTSPAFLVVLYICDDWLDGACHLTHWAGLRFGIDAQGFLGWEPTAAPSMPWYPVLWTHMLVVQDRRIAAQPAQRVVGKVTGYSRWRLERSSYC